MSGLFLKILYRTAFQWGYSPFREGGSASNSTVQMHTARTCDRRASTKYSFIPRHFLTAGRCTKRVRDDLNESHHRRRHPAPRESSIPRSADLVKRPSGRLSVSKIVK